ncbi:hypothetical protein PLESTF_001692300 [Pleodorina starrii]|nr:hypothetical protein PLESTM_000767600 [Pleodorina starrii]GLC75831.1 hypothetical protein PLESTF_001692300 [Pleodorina starrii]
MKDMACIWLPGIVACVARFLSPNEIACSLRLIDKATSQQFAGFKSVSLSRPSPVHAFKRRWGAPEAFRALTLEQRLKLLNLTAASGSVANLEVALGGVGLLLAIRSEPLEAAAIAAQLEACMLLRERGCPWGSSLASAAKAGHRHVCEWMLASGCPLTADAVYDTAHGGHEGLMLWLRGISHVDNDINIVAEELFYAAAHGLGLAALQRLHQQLLSEQQQQRPGGGEAQQHPALDQGQALAAAAGSPTPDWQAKVAWLEAQQYPPTHQVCVEAAGRGPGGDAVGRLQWLHGRGYPMVEAAVNIAASKGDSASLQFLLEQAGVQPGNFAWLLAASDGHLAILQYLHGRGVAIYAVEVVRSAASGGHLHVVAWAVETLGVTPDNAGGLLDEAAESGSIELMAWLRDRGWAWASLTVRKAAECGCEEAMEWLVERGCPLPMNGVPYLEAASQCDVAMVRCLQRLGCPWGPNLLGRCVQNLVDVHMLQCLVELGCPVDWELTLKSAERSRPGEYRTAVRAWIEQEQQRRSGG